MKRSIFTYFLLILICLYVFGSCIKESDLSIQSDIVSFIAINSDNNLTRTVRNEDGSIWWSPSDSIHIFYGGKSCKFTSTNTTPAASATFTGSLSGSSASDVDQFLALYPFSETSRSYDQYLLFSLQENQNAVAGSFDRDTYPAVARTSDFRLSFRNVCGGVKFCVSKPGVTKVTFKGNCFEPLAGRVKVGLDQGGIPYVEEYLQPSSEISITDPEGGSLLPGKWYYLVALPTSLPNGYTMTLVYEDNHREIVKTDKAVEIKRSKFGTLDNVDGKVTETHNPAGGKESGLYLGITGFNKALYYYPISLLNEFSLDDFHSFIDGLGQEHITLLYYSVKEAIRSLQFANYPSDLFSASIVTFTDGEDDGSVYYEKYPGSDEDYLSDVNTLLNEEEVAGLPLSAWTVGLQSADASNSSLFLKHLQQLSRPASNGVRVTNMSGVNSAFEKIAKELNQSFNIYNVSISMAGKPNGTKVRFTLDNASSANASTKYVEGCFDMYNASLYDVKYHGISCSSGSKVQGIESDGLITFRFENIRTNDNTEINPDWFKQWGWNTTVNSWHPYSEFNPGQDISMERVKKSAVVLLNLDCTTSLSSGSTDLFPALKSYAKAFVTRLWEYTLDSPSAVYSVSLDKTSLNLNVGESATLTAIVRPSTAADKSVTWSSSNTSVATVSSSGTVVGKQPGIATISAKTVDGGKIAQCEVSVGIVDLGLSVKWASCNLGATSIEMDGDYYGWGELSTKTNYTWSTYRFYKDGNTDSNVTFTKYVTSDTRGSVDYRYFLESGDDVARLRLGENWRLPTMAEYAELVNDCLWQWTSINGVYGMKVTSKKTGYTDKWIFLPASGSKGGTSVSDCGSVGWYLSSALYSDSFAVRSLHFTSSDVSVSWHGYRLAGFPVRPVLASSKSVTGVILNRTSVALEESSSVRLTATVIPETATNKQVTWSSSNPSIVSVDASGKVTALKVGESIITVTTVDGGRRAGCKVSVVHSSDLEEKLEKGYIIFHGTQYQVVKMKDGKWWMAQNLAYLPEGYTPATDLTAVTAGVFAPLQVNAGQTAAEFTTDPAVVAKNGYLYQAEVALGLKVGDLTSVADAQKLEAAQGICPKGWHVPTLQDIKGLVGKCAGETTNADAPYYSNGDGLIKLLNADGFNMEAVGAISIQDNTKTGGSFMGFMAAYPDRLTSSMFCGSSFAGVTYNTSGDAASGVKNLQFFGLMPMTNKTSTAQYTCNGTKVSYRIAGPVRCVRN